MRAGDSGDGAQHKINLCIKSANVLRHGGVDPGRVGDERRAMHGRRRGRGPARAGARPTAGTRVSMGMGCAVMLAGASGEGARVRAIRTIGMPKPARRGERGREHYCET